MLAPLGGQTVDPSSLPMRGNLMASSTSDTRLDTGTRKELERLLLRERDRLQQDLDTALDEQQVSPTGDAAGELSKVPTHPADAASHTDESDRDYRTAERATERITQIDHALERLLERPEEYGHCSVCGEPIAEERLKAVPWTRRCIDHAPAGA
jgi:RNA polymerase-binding transcription factor DksA